MAISSDATVMSYPVMRVLPFSSGPKPIWILRRKRSLMSMTRFQVIVSGSISSIAKRARSSGVRSPGSVFSIPNFLSRRSMVGAKVRLPVLSGGQSRSNMTWGSMPPSCSMRASMAAAMRSWAAVIA